MGFRSTFTIQSYGTIKWPDWFVDKYSSCVWFNESHTGTIASKIEAKIYEDFSDLLPDIQKAIDWDIIGPKKIVLVYLHECGGITRCQIERDDIKLSEPTDWCVNENTTHWHCHGCSDI